MWLYMFIDFLLLFVICYNYNLGLLCRLLYVPVCFCCKWFLEHMFWKDCLNYCGIKNIRDCMFVFRTCSSIHMKLFLREKTKKLNKLFKCSVCLIIHIDLHDCTGNCLLKIFYLKFVYIFLNVLVFSCFLWRPNSWPVTHNSNCLVRSFCKFGD